MVTMADDLESHLVRLVETSVSSVADNLLQHVDDSLKELTRRNSFERDAQRVALAELRRDIDVRCSQKIIELRCDLSVVEENITTLLNHAGVQRKAESTLADLQQQLSCLNSKQEQVLQELSQKICEAERSLHEHLPYITALEIQSEARDTLPIEDATSCKDGFKFDKKGFISNEAQHVLDTTEGGDLSCNVKKQSSDLVNIQTQPGSLETVCHAAAAASSLISQLDAIRSHLQDVRQCVAQVESACKTIKAELVTLSSLHRNVAISPASCKQLDDLDKAAHRLSATKLHFMSSGGFDISATVKRADGNARLDSLELSLHQTRQQLEARLTKIESLQHTMCTSCGERGSNRGACVRSVSVPSYSPRRSTLSPCWHTRPLIQRTTQARLTRSPSPCRKPLLHTTTSAITHTQVQDNVVQVPPYYPSYSSHLLPDTDYRASSPLRRTTLQTVDIERDRPQSALHMQTHAEPSTTASVLGPQFPRKPSVRDACQHTLVSRATYEHSTADPKVWCAPPSEESLRPEEREQFASEIHALRRENDFLRQNVRTREHTPSARSNRPKVVSKCFSPRAVSPNLQNVIVMRHGRNLGGHMQSMSSLHGIPHEK